MTLQRGWLKRQLNRAVEDIIQWPEWMRTEAGFHQNVRSPEYALRIAPDKDGTNDRERIARGAITVSIRPGFRRGYEPGALLLLGCHIEPWGVLADISGRRYCTMWVVTEEEYRAAGYESRGEMLVRLRRFYPDLQWESEVTVIRWQNVHGKLVDEYLDKLEDSD